MANYVDCPHQTAASRTCPGCTEQEEPAQRCPNPYCDGRGWIVVSATAISAAYRMPGVCKVGPHPPTPATVRCEDGEVEASVVQDSEGDPGVVYGVHYFYRLEDMHTTCNCVLTTDEQSRAEDELLDKGSHFEPDASDNPQFPY